MRLLASHNGSARSHWRGMMKQTLFESTYGRHLADSRPDIEHLRDAGIYLWTVDGAGRYVGKFSHRRRLRAYANNVYRMLKGQAHHASGFRTVHRALAKAFVDGRHIGLSIILPNPFDPAGETLSKREARLITQLGCLNDPPQKLGAMTCCCGLAPRGSSCLSGVSTRPLWDLEQDIMSEQNLTIPTA